MLIQQKIYNTIVNAKFFSRDLLTKIISQENYGEDTVTLKNQFIILGQWIRILEEYLDNNFDGNGNVIPARACLTLNQIEALIVKVKEVIGNNRYTLDSWILAYGTWRNSGRWENSNQWNNYVPLT